MAGSSRPKESDILPRIDLGLWLSTCFFDIFYVEKYVINFFHVLVYVIQTFTLLSLFLIYTPIFLSTSVSILFLLLTRFFFRRALRS